MGWRFSPTNADIEKQLFSSCVREFKTLYCDWNEEQRNFGKIIGIEDDRLSNSILKLFVGRIQVTEEVDPSEYCNEIKQILERGYFEVSYCDGAFIRRINIPKDWKPTIMTYEEA